MPKETTRLTVHTDGFDGWKKRARARARAMDEGERLTPSRGITFESAAEMVRLLTPARIDLFRTVRKRKIPIQKLAAELGRDISAVRRDVNALERFGIVSSQRVSNPSHGKMRVISAPAGISISAEL